MTSTTHDDDSMLDEEWLAAPRKRSRVRLVISAALIAAVCFLSGALAQKHLGAGDTASAPGALSGGFPGGDLPAGGFPGAAQQGSGAPSTRTETQTDATDQVIGTVIKKNDNVWLIEDLGGKRHEVVVAQDTDVVRETELAQALVKAGDRVQITGVERNDRLRAADITLR